VNAGLVKENEELLQIADDSDQQVALKTEEKRLVEEKLKEVSLTNESMQLGLDDLQSKKKDAEIQEQELKDKLASATTQKERQLIELE
jgi:hypothetical protein